MQEFPDLTLEEIAVFEASTPGRAARQFLAQRDPTVAWVVLSFLGDATKVAAARYADAAGNVRVLNFEQRGIAWLIFEENPAA